MLAALAGGDRATSFQATKSGVWKLRSLGVTSQWESTVQNS
jgi:hypothetical protein